MDQHPTPGRSGGAPTTIRASRLFVFAGAGASRSMPAGLPLFKEIRDEILRQLHLVEYLPGGADPSRLMSSALRGCTAEPDRTSSRL